jgi:hypothetical protein
MPREKWTRQRRQLAVIDHSHLLRDASETWRRAASKQTARFRLGVISVGSIKTSPLEVTRELSSELRHRDC